MDLGWNFKSNIDFYLPNFEKSKKYKLAAFDLDGTLITRSNSRHPAHNLKEGDEWTYLGYVLKTLKKLHKKGYLIVIITNQSKFNKIVFDQIESVRNDIEKNLDFSPFIFIAKKKDNFRKPEIGTIDLLYSIFKSHGDFKISKKSFFCGDAVGKNDEYLPYRWHDVDYVFSKNIGFKFKRPIDLFPSNNQEVFDNVKFYDIVIMVGIQGSGKSTFAKKLENEKLENEKLENEKLENEKLENEKLENENFCVVERDVLKTVPKMVKIAKEFLLQKKKIVIDATNGKEKDRQIWYDLAKNMKIKNICVVWCIRSGHIFNEERDKKIPSVALGAYSKNFQTPVHENTFILF